MCVCVCVERADTHTRMQLLGESAQKRAVRAGRVGVDNSYFTYARPRFGLSTLQTGLRKLLVFYSSQSAMSLLLEPFLSPLLPASTPARFCVMH